MCLIFACFFVDVFFFVIVSCSGFFPKAKTLGIFKLLSFSKFSPEYRRRKKHVRISFKVAQIKNLFQSFALILSLCLSSNFKKNRDSLIVNVHLRNSRKGDSYKPDI